MLNFQKNKLINLLLQFEVAANDAFNKTLDQSNTTTDALYNVSKIIDRNILSIKKQINKL